MGRFGFDLLADQAAEYAREIAIRASQESPWCGESEIEKLLSTALLVCGWLDSTSHQIVSPLPKGEQLPQGSDDSPIAFAQQVQIENVGRVDFVIYVFGRRPHLLRAPGWHQLIVECDGHDFHERTKEQAKRDRSRDRRALLNGHEVMRFTGSEIWNDPFGCVGEIFAWAREF